MQDASPAPSLRPGSRLGGVSGRLLGPALGVGLFLLLAGCGAGPISSPDSGVGCSVTVNIPSYGGQLLGTVQVEAPSGRYTFHRNTNTIALGCGEQAQLKVSPTEPGSHPFTKWSLPTGANPSSSIKVTVDGLVQVTPNFLVPKPTPGPSVLPSPSTKPLPSPSATPSSVTLDQWVSYDAASKTVIWKLVAGGPSVNNGLQFDNEAHGDMKVSVPVGWTVTVNFSNAGVINHSAAVVSGATATTPVFAGASTPSPTTGTAPGQSDSFTFVASQAGSYRMACLMPGHEDAGMWEAFTVTSGGLPTASL